MVFEHGRERRFLQRHRGISALEESRLSGGICAVNCRDSDLKSSCARRRRRIALLAQVNLASLALWLAASDTTATIEYFQQILKHSAMSFELTCSPLQEMEEEDTEEGEAEDKEEQEEEQQNEEAEDEEKDEEQQQQ